MLRGFSFIEKECGEEKKDKKRERRKKKWGAYNLGQGILL